MRTLESRSDETALVIGVLSDGPMMLGDFTSELANGIKRTPTLATLNKDAGAAANIVRQHCTRGTNPLIKRLGDNGQTKFILNPDHQTVQEKVDEARRAEWRKIILAAQPTQKSTPASVPVFNLQPGLEVTVPPPPQTTKKAARVATEKLAPHVSLYCDLRSLLLALHKHEGIGWWARELFPFRLLAQLTAMQTPDEKPGALIEKFRNDRVIRYVLDGKPVRGDQWNLYEISHAERYEIRYPLFRQPDLETGRKILDQLLSHDPPCASVSEILTWKAEVTKRFDPAVNESEEKSPQTNSATSDTAAEPPAPEPATGTPEPKAETPVVESIDPAPASTEVKEATTSKLKYHLDSLSDDELKEVQEKLVIEFARRQKRAELTAALTKIGPRVATAKTTMSEAIIAYELAEAAVTKAQKELLELERKQESLTKELAST